MVVISDRQSAEELATTGHQVLDQRALLAPITKWGATLEPAGAAAHGAPRAVDGLDASTRAGAPRPAAHDGVRPRDRRPAARRAAATGAAA